jgi:hypothetical protein
MELLGVKMKIIKFDKNTIKDAYRYYNPSTQVYTMVIWYNEKALGNKKDNVEIITYERDQKDNEFVLLNSILFTTDTAKQLTKIFLSLFSQENLDSRISKLVDENFWELK